MSKAKEVLKMFEKSDSKDDNGDTGAEKMVASIEKRMGKKFEGKKRIAMLAKFKANMKK